MTTSIDKPNRSGSLQKYLQDPEEGAISAADSTKYTWMVMDGEWVYVPEDATGVPLRPDGTPVLHSPDKPGKEYPVRPNLREE